MRKTSPTLGARVRSRRRALGLSQASLGRRLGISPSQVADIEADRTAGINSRRVARLAAVLDVSADWLLGLKGRRVRE